MYRRFAQHTSPTAPVPRRAAEPAGQGSHAALSLAFLNSVFKGDEAALASWPGQFAGILARFTRSTP